MERVVSQEEIRQALLPARREGKVIAFVPTMGALHDGHLSLVRAACSRADVVVTSIFVNPTQFVEGEDFDAYPRPLDHDLSLLKAEGVDIVFTPTASQMYRPGAVTTVHPGPIADLWEGASRPGHFIGVATIVSKLFNIVMPNLAFFGDKDFQQLQVIRQLVRDLDIPVTIVGCPIIRERNGLARSSRNAYLSPEERTAANVLHRALLQAEELLREGESDADVLLGAIETAICAEPLANLDYAAIVDPVTLEPLENVHVPARALVAATVGSARLIDNLALIP